MFGVGLRKGSHPEGGWLLSAKRGLKVSAAPGAPAMGFRVEWLGGFLGRTLLSFSATLEERKGPDTPGLPVPEAGR